MSGKDELLDKAIVEAKEAEDWQLVEWLRTARGSESAAQWYSDKLRKALRAERKLLNENAKMRKLCASLYGYAHDENPEGTELNFAEDMREMGIEVDG